jgi:DnaJ homolog subfamily C member 19
MIRILILAAIAAGIVLMIRRFMRSGGAMTPAEARRLLDVAEGADAETINAAHKRLIAKVHPDAGGNAELAARVNAARDLLLRTLSN